MKEILIPNTNYKFKGKLLRRQKFHFNQRWYSDFGADIEFCKSGIDKIGETVTQGNICEFDFVEGNKISKKTITYQLPDEMYAVEEYKV